eukprot:TRINITY_DN1784_c1_g1_i2.p1 TRINITY_DN1784_c1_g1~~TRINITY_DN1784_c1_g1_i2.p1  ORF type:complete len:859 (+),score=248.60 TRINITY_DN1784_c1_g1_i2:64-2640(+)
MLRKVALLTICLVSDGKLVDVTEPEPEDDAAQQLPREDAQANLEAAAPLVELQLEHPLAQSQEEQNMLTNGRDASEEATAADAFDVVNQKESNDGDRTIQEVQEVSNKATEVANSTMLLAETQALETNKQVTEAKQSIQHSWHVAAEAEQAAKAARSQAAAWAEQAKATSAREIARAQTPVSGGQSVHNAAIKALETLGQSGKVGQMHTEETSTNQADYVRPGALLQGAQTVDGVESREQPLSPSDVPERNNAQQKEFFAAMRDQFPSDDEEPSSIVGATRETKRAAVQALKANEYRQLQASNTAAAEHSERQQAFEAAKADELKREQIVEAEKWNKQVFQWRVSLDRLQSQKADALRQEEMASKRAAVAKSLALRARQLAEKKRTEIDKAAVDAARNLQFADIPVDQLPGMATKAASAMKVAAMREAEVEQLTREEAAQVAVAKRSEEQERSEAMKAEFLTREKAEQFQKFKQELHQHVHQMEMLKTEMDVAFNREIVADKQAKASMAAASKARDMKRVQTRKSENDAFKAVLQAEFVGYKSDKNPEAALIEDAEPQTLDESRAAPDAEEDQKTRVRREAREAVMQAEVSGRPAAWKAKRGQMERNSLKQWQHHQSEVAERKQHQQDEAAAMEEALMKQRVAQRDKLERMDGQQAEKMFGLQKARRDALERKEAANVEAVDSALAATRAKENKQESQAEVEEAAALAASRLDLAGVPVSEWPARIVAAEGSANEAHASSLRAAHFKQVQVHQRKAQAQGKKKQAAEASTASQLARLQADREAKWTAERELELAKIRTLQDETVAASRKKQHAKMEAQAAAAAAARLSELKKKEAIVAREAEDDAEWQAETGEDIFAD